MRWRGLTRHQAMTATRNPEPDTMPRIIFNRILGGWFIVRGPHQTPISGRFESRAQALAHLNRNR